MDHSLVARGSISDHLPALLSELHEQPNGSLFMELRSPSGRKFWLSTKGREITVGFDEHHVHFGTPWEPDAAGDVEQAREYIEKLMSGQYLVAVWSRGGQFVQSETVERGVDPAKVSRSWFGRWWLKGCVVELRGW